MKQTYRHIHRNFKLNGITFDRNELKEVAYSLIKEGEPFEKEIGIFLLDWLDDKLTIEVNTSGSTGTPKRMTLLKRHMVNSALATGEFFGLTPGDSALLCLPANYIAGKMMLVRAVVLGLSLDFTSPNSRPMDHVSKKYDFVAMVPLQLENSLQSLRKVKTLIVGGAPLTVKIQNYLNAMQPTTAIYETYGMTETITHIALKNVNSAEGSADNFSGNLVDGYNKYRFKTLPGVVLSVDERNCLIIDAPKISDVSIVTNDVVDLISNTEFLWLGRYDNIINSGGVKLFPEHIEEKLSLVIHSRFFVYGIPDEKLGQKLILVMEGNDKMDEAITEKTMKKIQSLDTLKKYEVPQNIFRVTKFLETESGKIKRKKTLATLAI